MAYCRVIYCLCCWMFSFSKVAMLSNKSAVGASKFFTGLMILNFNWYVILVPVWSWHNESIGVERWFTACCRSNLLIVVAPMHFYSRSVMVMVEFEISELPLVIIISLYAVSIYEKCCKVVLVSEDVSNRQRNVAKKSSMKFGSIRSRLSLVTYP